MNSKSNVKHSHIISARQFDQKFLEKIFAIATQVKLGNYDKNALKNKIMATVFYEPSTRTRLSFESAMLRVGGQVISTENAKEFSSAAKGESLEDTIRILNSYCDVIVLRHHTRGASEIASQYSRVPLINAGDGDGEHPTQALLDLYTIFSKFKDKDITVSLIGDLLNGRTIHSLAYLLSLYPKIKISFVSPKALAIPSNLRADLINKKVQFKETENLKEGLAQAEVIYMTRIQKERFKTNSEYQKYFGKYIINLEKLHLVKKNAIILHPLPRINEIAKEVDRDSRSLYFEQAANGLYIRVALLLFIFDFAKTEDFQSSDKAKRKHTFEYKR